MDCYQEFEHDGFSQGVAHIVSDYRLFPAARACRIIGRLDGNIGGWTCHRHRLIQSSLNCVLWFPSVYQLFDSHHHPHQALTGVCCDTAFDPHLLFTSISHLFACYYYVHAAANLWLTEVYLTLVTGYVHNGG